MKVRVPGTPRRVTSAIDAVHSTVTVTVPPHASVAFPVGSVLEVVQTGAGQVTLAPGAGVTLNAAVGLKSASQWAVMTLRKRGTNAWIVAGDVTA